MQLYKKKMNTFKESIYPIGSIYLNYTNPENPSILLGFGEWEQVKDKFILAAGDTYEINTSGGIASYKLTKEELPFYVSEDESVGYGLNTDLAFIDRVVVQRPNKTPNNAVDNMPPYETAYIWKRIK